MADIVVLLAGCDSAAIQAAQALGAQLLTMKSRTINEAAAGAEIRIVAAFDEDEVTIAQKREFDSAIGTAKSRFDPSRICDAFAVVAPDESALSRPLTRDWEIAVTSLGNSVHRYSIADGEALVRDPGRMAMLFPETWLKPDDAASVLPDQPRVRFPAPCGLELPEQQKVMRQGASGSVKASDAILCVLAEQERPEVPLGMALAVEYLTWKNTESRIHGMSASRTRIWRSDDMTAIINQITKQSSAAFAAIPELPLRAFGSQFRPIWNEQLKLLKLGSITVEGQWQKAGEFLGPTLLIGADWRTETHERKNTSSGLLKCGSEFVWLSEESMPFEFVETAKCHVIEELLPQIAQCLSFWRANCRLESPADRLDAWLKDRNGACEAAARFAEGIWTCYYPWPDPFALRKESEQVVEPSRARHETELLFKTLVHAPFGSAPPNLVANFLAVIGGNQRYDMQAWASEVQNGWSFKLKTRDHYWIDGTILTLPEELRTASRTLQVRDHSRVNNNCYEHMAALEFGGVHCSIRTDSLRP